MTDTPQTPPAPMQAPAEPIKAPALPYSFKANLKTYWQRLGAMRIVIAFAISFIFWYRFGFTVWVFSVIGLAILIWVLLFLISSRRVTLRPDGIDYRGWYGKVRHLQYDQIEGVKVFLQYLEPGFGITPRIAIAVKGGTPINFTMTYWSPEDLDKMLAVFAEKNIPTEYFQDIATNKAIAQQFPAYAEYAERHPGAVVAISLAAIILLVIAITFWVFLS